MSETPYLTLRQLQDITATVKLKAPGEWTLRVVEDEFLGAYLRITGRLPDNARPGASADLGIDARVPPCRIRDDYLNWLLHRWVEIWVHEAREQFEVAGVLWSDPHAAG